MKISALLSATALCLGLVTATSAAATDYEDFNDISPGFGSRTGTGVSGGSVSAHDKYGSECTGYIDESPDHTVIVTSEVDMAITVSSDTDSVLVVKRIGREYKAWCADDNVKGEDEKVSGTFPPGRYEVYVGVFDEDENEPYTLHIVEGEGAGIRPRAQQNQQRPSRPSSSNQASHPHSTQGRYGNFTVGAGFTPDPQTATGVSGYSDNGRVDAATFGKQCMGFIDTSPDHTITVTSAVNLRLTVSSEIDSVLVIRGPAGTFCDDDSAGDRDAQVNALFTPGDYEVYVGNIGEAGEYILTVTESSQGGYVT